jgi:hypothetical protein
MRVGPVLLRGKYVHVRSLLGKDGMSDSEYLRYRALRFRHLAWLTSHPAAKAELETMAREYEERASEMADPREDAGVDALDGSLVPDNQP